MATDSDILYALQRGLPLVQRPFAQLAADLGTDEARVVAFVQELFDTGKARRMGAVFDARRLGYQSALCAVRVDDAAQTAQIGQMVAQYPGVTHCYERGWPTDVDTSLPGGPTGALLPNLWFTFAVLSDRFDDGIEDVRKTIAPHDLLVLPATSRFKIDVVFDPRTRDRDERFPGSVHTPGTIRAADEAPAELTDQDRQIVRRLQGNLKPDADVYAKAAADLGLDTDDLLSRLQAWKDNGVLRRMALIVRHRRIGFRANGMCTWCAPPGDVARAGRTLAAQPEVTHCYERVMMPEFPFNVFAMIHTGAWDSTCALFQRLSDTVGLDGGRVLFSIREFKKSSMRYFEEGND